ncbi:hypothetical protein [Bartonella tribocorum]|uniref:Uncharacterized protein n=1 Tax=Bartonella tribocorum TaxID=85701 RepID=A0A2M6USM0_9HYPH|nr:hypothetical protein [Bartonella tribocorum]PIT69179.1 hypothetical protein CER18_03955 [Bartonella tribocorum]
MDEEIQQVIDNPVKEETNNSRIIVNIKFILKWVRKFGYLGFSVMGLTLLKEFLVSLGYSTNVLLGFAMGIVFCVVGIMLVAKIYHNKQLTEQLKQKDREYQIYKKIVEEGEQRLFEKTQKISKEWVEKWDEGIRQWERDILGIKNPRAGMKVHGNRPSLVKNICAQGERELPLLYKEALATELTDEQIAKIYHLLNETLFEEHYVKAGKFMEENGISLQGFVNTHTNKEHYKPTTLLLHWLLYVLDDVIIAECKKQKEKLSKKKNEKQKFADTLWDNISIPTTEYEEIEKMFNDRNSLSNQCALLLYCKKDVLSLLYDISSDYKTARETFIYYKKLIKTVKKGYMAFDKGCSYTIVKDTINTCKNNDASMEQDSSIVEGTLTLKKAYASGARGWLRSSNEKCDDRLIFWEKLVGISNSQKKLKIIFGEKQLKKLEEAVEKEREQVKREMREAIFEKKDFCYYRSRAHFIGCLQDD